MVKTVLYAEKLYDNDKVEREVFGPDVRVVWRNVANLSQLEDSDCADIDGLMVMRHAVTAEHFARFPKLACVVRMGVGYDKIDRSAAYSGTLTFGGASPTANGVWITESGGDTLVHVDRTSTPAATTC